MLCLQRWRVNSEVGEGWKIQEVAGFLSEVRIEVEAILENFRDVTDIAELV